VIECDSITISHCLVSSLMRLRPVRPCQRCGFGYSYDVGVTNLLILAKPTAEQHVALGGRVCQQISVSNIPAAPAPKIRRSCPTLEKRNKQNAQTKIIKEAGFNSEILIKGVSRSKKDIRAMEAPDAAIKPTTAGRNPPNMPCINGESLYFENNNAKESIMTKDGATVPAVAEIAPNNPAAFVPAKVAAFMPIGPGVICETVTTSVNSDRLIHANLSTATDSMSGRAA